MTRIVVLFVIAMVISGCDYDPHAIAAKQKELDSRLTKLENTPSPVVTPPTPTIPTVLWVQNPGAYPRASAYFDSKLECAQSAEQWGFPDDKGAKKVGVDPWITSSSKGQAVLTVSCLPQGVAPYAK
jgi:hypothetical protein